MNRTVLFFLCLSFGVLTTVNAQEAPDDALKKQQAAQKKWEELQNKEEMARVKKEIAKQKEEEAQRKKVASEAKKAEQKKLADIKAQEKREANAEKARLAAIAKEEKIIQDKEKQRLKKEEALAQKAAAESAKQAKLIEEQAATAQDSAFTNTEQVTPDNNTASVDGAVTDTVPSSEASGTEPATKKSKKKPKPKKKEKETGLDLFGPAREKQYSTPSDSASVSVTTEPSILPTNTDTVSQSLAPSPTVLEQESPKKKTESAPKRSKRDAVMVAKPHPKALARCGLVQNSVDEMTALKRMVLGDEVLFVYNKPGGNPKELKDQDLLTCISQVSNYGGEYYLKLTFYFAIPYARSEYGFIIENMPITFVTLSNSSIELSNEKQIQGKVMNNASTIYEVSLPLEGKDLKALRTAEIDRIIVNWKSGTESFEVFDVDVLARQIQCMDRHVRK